MKTLLALLTVIFTGQLNDLFRWWYHYIFGIRNKLNYQLMKIICTICKQYKNY